MITLITFPSTHDALRAEKLLLKAQMDVTLIPVPRGIASDCGLALRFQRALLERVLPVLCGQVILGKCFVKETDHWQEIPLAQC